MKRNAAVALVLVLFVLQLHSQETAPRVITISAKKFEFTPSQLTLKRGEPVTIRVSAEDRDHGLYQKELHIALDLTTDHVAEVTITPDRAGRFVAICDHFCGSGHGNMKLIINVE
jgi:cytochrome c oxidase subunit 2